MRLSLAERKAWPMEPADHLVAVCIAPGPQAIARLSALARTGQLRVTCLTLATSARLRDWRPTFDGAPFEVVQLFDGCYESVPRRPLHRRLRQALRQLAPSSVVVFGYDDPAMRLASRWARTHGAASLTFWETWGNDRPRTSCRELAKRLIIPHLYDGAFVAGERAAAYAASLGIPPSRMVKGYAVVDNQQFADGAEDARRNEGRLRTELGLPQRYFVYAGRFSPEKNLLTLLDAYGQYRDHTTQSWGLVMVGGGPQEAQLRALAAERGLADIAWLPFQEQEDVPRYYGLASCLVLPSIREPWGLVVNEAMAAGLPVLASDLCGCAPELVRNGVNGFTFDPLDRNALAQLMMRMASDDGHRKAMGHASKEIIAEYTPGTWAHNLLELITRCR